MRVLVVEDQKLFREVLVRRLEKHPAFSRVTSAKDGEEALAMIMADKPQLVLLDILIPKLSGILVAQRVLEHKLPVRIVAFSAEADLKTLYEINRLGLWGYFDKSSDGLEQLETALACFVAGKRYFSPQFLEATRQLRANPMGFEKLLTRREQEILTLIGAGMQNEEIASELNLKVSSVQGYRSKLAHKLGCSTSLALMRTAHELGFWKTSFKKMHLQRTYHAHK